MKTKFSLLMTLLLTTSIMAISQEKTKDEQKKEKQDQIETLMNLKAFKFVGKMANPSGMRSVNLTTNPNFVNFSPDMIESEMPFFGSSHTPMGYGGDAGLKFTGKPEKFTVEKGKKNYEIEVVVKGENDKYKMYLTVSTSGSATLSVSSNNRSNISYTGDIFELEKK